MIGALFNTYRGIKENRDLKGRKYTVEKELNSLDSVDKMLAQIEDPYERVVAKNQLTLAEYMNERQNGQSIKAIKNTWELVKKQMVTNIESVEEQLNQLQATKLDIARIVATLSQLSNELDLELEEVKQRVSINEELQTKIEDLQNPPLNTDLKKRLDKIDMDVKKFKDSINQLAEFQLKKINKQLTGLDKMHAEHREANEQYRNKTNNQIAKLQHQADGIQKNIDAKVSKLKKIENELEELNTTVDTLTDSLKSSLQDQQRRLYYNVDKIDKKIEEQAIHTKETILKFTIPLYVIIIIGLFI